MIKVIKGKVLIDGTGPSVGLRDPVVVVREGVIQAVGTAQEVAVPQGDTIQVLDFPDKWIVPGLIDAHVHLVFSAGQDTVGDLLRDTDEVLLLRAARNAQLALCAGITTVRDCGGRGRTVQALRDAINAGVITGPRVLSSGIPITTTAGHCHYLGLTADNAPETRKAARGLVRDGVDFLKVMVTGGTMTPGSNAKAAQYSVEEIRVVVEEGHRLGKKVAVHVLGTPGIRNAVEAGVDTLEHCNWLGQEGCDYDEGVVAEMVRRGIYVDPTMAAAYLAFPERGLFTGDMATVFQLRAEKWGYLRRMRQAGVVMLAGTDAGAAPFTTFDSLVTGLELMVRHLELSPVEALLSATRNSAEALGLGREIGTVEVGKQADLVIISADPLQDIGALRQVHRVFKGGELVASAHSLLMAPQ